MRTFENKPILIFRVLRSIVLHLIMSNIYKNEFLPNLSNDLFNQQITCDGMRRNACCVCALTNFTNIQIYIYLRFVQKRETVQCLVWPKIDVLCCECVLCVVCTYKI